MPNTLLLHAAAPSRRGIAMLVAALVACAACERRDANGALAEDTSSASARTDARTPVAAVRIGVPFDLSGPPRALPAMHAVFTGNDQPVLLDADRSALIALNDSARIAWRTRRPPPDTAGTTVSRLLALGGDTVVVHDVNSHTLRVAVGGRFTDTIIDLSIPFGRTAWDRTLLGRLGDGHWVFTEQIQRVDAPNRDGEVRVTVDTPVVFATRGNDIPKRIVGLPPVTHVMLRRGSAVHYFNTRRVTALVSVCDSGVVMVSPQEIVQYDARGQVRRRAVAPRSPDILQDAARRPYDRDTLVNAAVAGVERPVPDTVRRVLHALTDFSAQPLPPMIDRMGRIWYRSPTVLPGRHRVFTLDGTLVGTVDGVSWALAAGDELALSMERPTEARTAPALTLFRVPSLRGITSGVGQCQRGVWY